MGKSLLFAYADPPYPGCGHRYPEKAEVDHARLLGTLMDRYSDGWALSTSSVALQAMLPLCPRGVRVLSWCKPFAVFKPNVGLAYTWEPVILYGGRRRTRQQPTMKDHLIENITLRKGLVGAKPWKFCWWIFDALNAQPGDALHDLYPGTGIVTRAWHGYFDRPVQEILTGVQP